MISDPTDPPPPRAARPDRRPLRARAVDLRPWQLLVAALLAVGVALLTAAPAAAHAYLLSSDPPAGAQLDRAPDTVTLEFNEPIGVDDDSLRLFDADADRVDDGPVDTADHELAVAVPDDLPDGAYVVAYRVISADSHPVGGTLTFTVGDATPLDAATASAIGGTEAGAIGTVGAVLRGIGYLAVLLAAGAVAFAAFVGLRPTDRRRAAWLGSRAALVAAVVALVHVPVQAAAVSGRGLDDVLTDVGTLSSTLGTSFGQSTLVRLAGLVLLVAAWQRPRDQAPATDPLLLGGGILALGSYLLDGHQRTYEPVWLLLGADTVHLAGAAVWAGGLALLFATLRARRRDDDPAGAARVVARFSGLALWSVLALTAAGVAMSWPLVRSSAALTSTTYGQLLLVKVALVAVVVAVAAYNRRQLVPAVATLAVPAGAAADVEPGPAGAAGSDTSAAWRQLTSTVRLELVLLVAIAGVTGFLATTQPAAEAAGLTGPVAETAALTADLDVDFVVDPAEPGLNALHVYVVDASGQPTDAIEDLRLAFTYVDEGIGPIDIEPFVAGPGHWTANVDDLTFAGSWEVRIVAGEDRFTEHEVTIPFELAG